VSGQIGSEKTPGEFVKKMVEVFADVHRVLRDDGTLWLNLGDTFHGKGISCVPWLVALALRKWGWILRQDIIWHKPSCMPESCHNRCTKAHEYIFLLVKRSGYFYDDVAIKTDAIPTEVVMKAGGRKFNQNYAISLGKPLGPSRAPDVVVRTGDKSNKRSVWTVSSQGYDGAHYATFPEKLIEPCILAGTSAAGACPQCHAPWKRQVNCTVGWETTCTCGEQQRVPCVVLDPFMGSGTTAVVSLAHRRAAWGIDLSEKYLRDNAIPRIEGAILARPALVNTMLESRAKRVDIGKPLRVRTTNVV
jgi:DNA modification methylase